ncbi:MAG: helix-turn-helix domain-containing protein [Cyanobacteria bacterium SID2]|nr:helix-turn-helix domain-containing protein [Cyanobacteria bacterium SID2]MBP0003649.1 helix-turn-helix domain-containing protein [Cyanobacteria bacterium SBC]
MSGVPKIEIQESVKTLQQLLKRQESATGFAKVQALYLLKIQAAETVRYLAVLLNRSEPTVHRWLKLYREGGVEALLEERKSPGRPKASKA